MFCAKKMLYIEDYERLEGDDKIVTPNTGRNAYDFPYVVYDVLEITPTLEVAISKSVFEVKTLNGTVKLICNYKAFNNFNGKEGVLEDGTAVFAYAIYSN